MTTHRVVGLLCAVFGCNGGANAPQMVPIYDDAASEAAPLVPPPHAIACTIPYDHEEMNHMLALDECLGPSRSACWAGCESTCTTCGAGCASDAACEAHCLTERDTCKKTHCVDIHDQCRTALVRSWLSNKCDSVCPRFHACVVDCANNPSPDCQAKCDAMGTPACNPYRCDALLGAPERKTLDPRWRANDCDHVCGRVWQCAEAQCSKSSCVEAVKMYLPCVARVAGAGACGLAQAQSLCPEP
jgi:hypothetical protein